MKNSYIYMAKSTSTESGSHPPIPAISSVSGSPSPSLSLSFSALNQVSLSIEHYFDVPPPPLSPLHRNRRCRLVTVTATTGLSCFLLHHRLRHSYRSRQSSLSLSSSVTGRQPPSSENNIWQL